MKEIFKGGAYRMLYMAFNFGVGLLIAYLSGAALFGTISLLVINASIFQIVSGLGTDSAIIWHGSREKVSPAQLFTFSFSAIAIQVLLFLVISLTWYQVFDYTMLSNSMGGDAYVYELTYFIGLVFMEKYMALLYARQQSVVANKMIAVVIFLLLLVLSLFYFELTNFNPDPFIFFIFIPLAQAIPLVWYYHRDAILKFTVPARHQIRSFLNFSFIVFITNTIQFLAYRIDYWVLLYFYTTVELGIYAQANRFAQLQWVIPNIAASLVIPALAAAKPRLNDPDFLSLVKMIFVSGIIIGILLSGIAYLLFTYFLPAEFWPGFRALVLMLPGFYFFTLNILFAAWFAARRKLWINFKGSLICLITIFIADMILIPRYSFNGAAIGNSIAYSIAAFYSLYMFLKLSPFKPIDLVQISLTDWRKISKLYGR